MNDVAVASLTPQGQPIIRYNPNVLARLSQTSRLFWYLHECGHHALAHTLGRNMGLASEREADCWAAKKLRELKQMSSERLRNLAAELRFSAGDWTHLPGPARTIDIIACAGGVDDPVEPPGPGSCRTVFEECTHPAHAMGDRIPCSHPAHPRGDLSPCQHVCGFTPYGPMPCHPNGDLSPCMHPAHALGDLTPCVHKAHPQGHSRTVCD